MSAKPKILVTGATGRTGAPTVQYLLENGFPVRAFVHRLDARSDALRKLGAEIFVGDVLSFDDVSRALDGVQRAYYCPILTSSLLHASTVFAMAAEARKLEVVALLSQWHPNPTDPSVVTREHWLTNNLFRWMPSVDVIHVNPGLFAFISFACSHFRFIIHMHPSTQGHRCGPPWCVLLCLRRAEHGLEEVWLHDRQRLPRGQGPRLPDPG